MWIPVRYHFTYGKRLSTYLNIYTHSTSSVLSVRFKTVTMKKYLNVAEKNDAAKNIAMHLSRGNSQRREGLSKFNKIYEFKAQVFNQESQMVMTSVSGHLLALDFVTQFRKWNSCPPETLFSAHVVKYCPDNYQKIKETLEREVRSCDGLIIWTDCDREGENIGFEIIKVCRERKSNLAIYRAKFSEITSASVHRALRNLEQPNENISNAVDVRQELDLRIGAAFTRLQTMRLTKVFPDSLKEHLISYGSCQFPTLGFVVERYRAIENFVAEYFWKLIVKHTIGNLTVTFTWERGRLFDKDCCEVLYNIVKENPSAKVIKVNTHPKSKWRPLPLDTVELEKLASRKLKINAKETMQLAEKLYTRGFISYPRTETNQFPKEMNLRNLVEIQREDSNWGSFAQRIIDDGGPTPRHGNKTDMAHPPIHPTKYTNELSGNEARLYEFIVRSFLACCSKDAQGIETTVTINVANEIFTANGLLITARNYLDVYPYDKWSSKEIHPYELNQCFIASPTMEEGTTSAPNLLTEADLIALMEKHGIGTDATHAEHIETIKIRNYVTVTNGVHFMPTLLGMGLVEGYDAMDLHMSEPHLRAQLEADLKAISEGRKQPHVVLADQIEKYRNAFIKVMAMNDKLYSALAGRLNEQPRAYDASAEPPPVSVCAALKCPKCGADMMVKRRKNPADGFYIGCVSYPSCKNAVWLPKFVKNVEVLQEKCPTCGPNYNKLKFELQYDGAPYEVCIGGCDSSVLERLNINSSSVRTSSNSVSSLTNGTMTNGTNSSRNTSSSGRTFSGSSTSGTYSGGQNSNFRMPGPQNSNVRMPRPQNSHTRMPRSQNSNTRMPGTQNLNMRMPRPQNSNTRMPAQGSNSDGNGPRAPRRCGICRQQGHTRNNCPNYVPPH